MRVELDAQNRPILATADELENFTKFTRMIPGEEPLTWNEALWENMQPRRPGQHNTELIKLMKSIEAEIADRQRWQAVAEDMQLVSYAGLE